MLNKITIIGVGLIGGSLALACKKNNLVSEIVGCSRKQSTIDIAIKLGIIDKGYTNIAEAVANSDLIIICTPLATYASIAKELSKHIKHDAIITDVGSVKFAPSLDVMENLKPSQISKFIPAHPIAGTEKSGPKAAFAELFEGNKLLITPPSPELSNQLSQEDNIPPIDKHALSVVHQLWAEIGADVSAIDILFHDKIYAYVSHSVQFISYAFMLRFENTPLHFTSISKEKGLAEFKKFIRLANSDVTMWQDIFVSNYSNVIQAIDAITGNLRDLAILIQHEARGAITNLINDAKNKRNQFCDIVDKPHPYRNSDLLTGILPFTLSLAIIDNIDGWYYKYASGAGLHGITRNAVENTLNADDFINNKDELLSEISILLGNIKIISDELKDNKHDVRKTLARSNAIYSQISPNSQQ